MSVDEPQACYKCHTDIYAKNAMPSHHPIKEGKMVCSDCHDPHGQTEDNLKEPTVNMVCYKCHGDKQGPFAYEHPPVTENCAICHDPHGTVATTCSRNRRHSFVCVATRDTAKGQLPRCTRFSATSAQAPPCRRRSTPTAPNATARFMAATFRRRICRMRSFDRFRNVRNARNS